MVVPGASAGKESIFEEEDGDGNMEDEDDDPKRPIEVGRSLPKSEFPAQTPIVDKKFDSATGRESTTTVSQKKRNPEKKRRRRTVVAAVTAIFVLCVSGGWFLWWLKSDRCILSQAVPGIDFPLENAQPQTVFRSEESEIVDEVHDDVLRLQAMIQSINRLRDETIEKRMEVEELREYYEDGIDAEIKGIVDVVQASGMNEVTFQAASENSRIRLGLNAVQRRNATIQKLETPLHRLVLNSEELLFFFRRAKILTMMAGKTSDIDIDGFLGKTTDICDRFKSELALLTIDEKNVSPVSLTSIWKDVARRLRQKPVDPVRKEQGNTAENNGRWVVICSGDFSEMDRLTALSPEAARCLTKWEGKDLYLNGLTRLSPAAAYHLSAWKGEWLGLNGLIALTPKTASHLVNWKGNVLSLNGLSHLSPEVVDILSGWQGDQIELIGVEQSVHWKNPKTRLFLSEKFRRHQFAQRE